MTGDDLERVIVDEMRRRGYTVVGRPLTGDRNLAVMVPIVSLVVEVVPKRPKRGRR